jgi:hypothetical protein
MSVSCRIWSGFAWAGLAGLSPVLGFLLRAADRGGCGTYSTRAAFCDILQRTAAPRNSDAITA